MKRITIKDIAKYAGVNHTTVSRVINNSPGISIATKEKIIKIIKKYNYHPNTAARALAGGKTQTLAIAALYLTSRSELDVLKGIDEKLKETNSPYEVTIHTTRDMVEKREKILKGILYGNKADGLIIMSLPVTEKIIKEFRDNDFPVVVIEDLVPGAHSVGTDNYKGGFMAAEHLIKRGRKKIGYVACGKVLTYDLETSVNYDGERYRGYRKALNEYGVEFRDEYVVRIENTLVKDGPEALEELLKQAPDIDSIFCAAGDDVAAGIIRKAELMGIKVPDDIALVGYDNNFMSQQLTPALTTITNHHKLMGSTAVEILISEIADGIKEPKTIKFKPEIIIRKSS